MALLQVNATGCQWAWADGGPDPLTDLLADLPQRRPVVVMIHGFRYAPGNAGDDPHQTILSPDGGSGFAEVSWPRHLGIRHSDAHGPLGIAFGWRANRTLWQARAEALRAGLALAALIVRIRALSPGRRITVMAHSLGARVLLSSLSAIAPGDLSRVILLFPALLQSELDRAMTFPAASRTEFIHVTSRENRLFDFVNSSLSSAGFCRPILRDNGARHASWTDLPLDCHQTLTHLAGLGFRISARQRRVCHWASYMRPGVFALYRALIADPVALPLHMLAPNQPAAETIASRGCGGSEFAVS